MKNDIEKLQEVKTKMLEYLTYYYGWLEKKHVDLIHYWKVNEDYYCTFKNLESGRLYFISGNLEIQIISGI